MAVSLVPSAAEPAIPAFHRRASYRSNQYARATGFRGHAFSPVQRASNPLQLTLTTLFPLKKMEKRGLQSLRCRCTCCNHTPKQFSEENLEGKFCRRTLATNFLSSLVLFPNVSPNIARAEPSVVFREYVDNFDGYTFYYPGNWIQVRGAGADVFFRDPFILDENLSLEISSPSSSNYTSVEDLGPPEEAGKKVLRQLLTEFMSTRLGVRRESRIISTSSRLADDGKIYYQVEANIKSYANNNELAVMPQERITRLEWDRHYLSVLGVENNRLYELRLQTPVKVFLEEENDLRRVMDSFRVFKATN